MEIRKEITTYFSLTPKELLGWDVSLNKLWEKQAIIMAMLYKIEKEARENVRVFRDQVKSYKRLGKKSKKEAKKHYETWSKPNYESALGVLEAIQGIKQACLDSNYPMKKWKKTRTICNPDDDVFVEVKEGDLE